ncbi:discoidin domain-containing protein [Saccharicrinis aurantiacus]|uniref:discoidin domain-containing protein n=1 Tax=Saccharicrinis aurantiacus TaxID=1849719 RepID=UPI00248FD9EC|nr:discoidin domain-containing protein [Saccharicrinis aurantiacus]
MSKVKRSLKYRHIMALACLFFGISGLMAQQNISLHGKWKVKLDDENSVSNANTIATDFDKEVNLPGTTDNFKLGTQLNTDTIQKPFEHLFRKYAFIGKAWYYRQVEIPADWKGKYIDLNLEMVKWTSELFIDGKKVDTQNSLIAPHKYNVSEYLTPGTHSIAIAVDNTQHFDVGLSHAYTEETQTIWNGILGDMDITAHDPIRISHVATYPNVTANTVKVALTINNGNKKAVKGSVNLSANVKNHKVNEIIAEQTFEPGESIVELEYALGDEKYMWSEFSPNVYNLKVCIAGGKGKKEFTSKYETTFGMRDLVSDGHFFRLNGDKIFLRGTLDCSIYPKTGHPPTELQDWIKIMKATKDYGLNHIRYHSWCPPKAAFEAADQLGVYLQVELPSWSFNFGKDEPTNVFFNQEAERMIKEYGNHPSFCLFTLGNELEGDYDYMNAMVNDLRKLDNRHLYSVSAFTFQKGHGKWAEPSEQYFITQITKKGWVRGQGFFNEFSPNSKDDYRASIDGLPVPLISHEIGQYSVYPRMAEIEKYDGVLDPFSLVTIREDLREKGLLHQAEDFTLASGKLAELLYKEEIERAFRTPNQAGFQLLQLTDFPGQSTAHVGLLDAFWESKGIITEKSFKAFCSQSVLLLRTDHFIYENNQTFKGVIEFANYSANKFDNAEVKWVLADQKGNVFKEGSFNNNAVAQGEYFIFGDINIDFSSLDKATHFTLSAQINNTEVENTWDLWVYPTDKVSKPKGVLVSNDLDEVKAALAKGRKVIYNPSVRNMKKKVSGKFVPVFWSPVHFPKQAGTMGILCNPEHDALADFPTDYHSNWQWWDMTREMSVIDISDLNAEIDPIVQVIDNFARNAKLSGVMEVKVGKGSLIISAFDITNNLDERPVARQMLKSLQTYAQSDAFAPKVEIAQTDLDDLFLSKHPWQSSTIVSSTPGQKGYEAKNVLDGDHGSLWHTEWNGNEQEFPHEIVIDASEVLSIKGIRLVQRGSKGGNGHVKEFEVYISKDKASFDKPQVVGQCKEGEPYHDILFSQEYMDESKFDCRYIKIKVLSSQNGKPYTAIAEVEIIE